MALSNVAGLFGQKMRALADAIRSRAFVSGSLTIDEMTATVLAMDADDTARAIVEGQPIALSTPASKVRPDAFIRHYSITAADMSLASEIGTRAFQECVNLSEVTVGPECDIGPSAFYGCNSLESFEAARAKSVGAQAFQNCVALPSIGLPECLTVGPSAFQGCTDLSRASMPEATSIGVNAFYGCTDLAEVEMPKVASAQSSVFQNCSKLTDVDARNLRTIYYSAFWNCQKLSRIALPMVDSIQSSAFTYCYRLTELDLTGRTYVPTLGNVNAFSSTPMYNYSASAGAWGRILVPSSLYASFRAAAQWSAMSARMVSMSAVAGSLVDAFPDGVEMAAAQGVEITSQSASGGAVDVTLSKAASTTTGFNLLMTGLTPLAQYMVELTLAMSASFVSSTTARLGFRVGTGGTYSSYGTSSYWFNNVEHQEAPQAVSLPFYATASTAYLAMVLTGLSNTAAEVSLTGMKVREATWEEME